MLSKVWLEPRAKSLEPFPHYDVAMRALIFDLDGTLVDTVYAHVFAWQQALAEAGMPIDGWRVHRRIGMSGGLFTRAIAREIGRALEPDHANALQHRHGEIYRTLLPRPRPLPGAVALAAPPARPGHLARDRDVGPAARDQSLARDARDSARDGGHRARRRHARQARARPLPGVPGAAGRRDSRLLRHRRRGLGSARRSPRGNAQRRGLERRLRRRGADSRRRLPRLPRCPRSSTNRWTSWAFCRRHARVAQAGKDSAATSCRSKRPAVSSTKSDVG